MLLIFVWLPLLGSEPPFADEVCADLYMPTTANFAVCGANSKWFVAIKKETKKETKE